MRVGIVLWALATLLMACSSADEGEVSSTPDTANVFPELDAPELVLGREVWLGTCKGCHAYGFAGAPKAGVHEAWASRIAQGRDVLYAHAIEGYFGPTHTHMPPRGGNQSLTDEQVRAAVDYMLALID